MQLGKKLLRSRRLQMLQREIKTFLGTGINSYNSARTEKKTTFFDACSPEYWLVRRKEESWLVYRLLFLLNLKIELVVVQLNTVWELYKLNTVWVGVKWNIELFVVKLNIELFIDKFVGMWFLHFVQ